MEDSNLNLSCLVMHADVYVKFLFRLWHQLTLKLAQFVKDDYFVQNGGLVEVHEQ